MNDPASSAPDPVRAYVASILDALGTRDPFEVLREGPEALRAALAGLTPAQLTTPERQGKWSVLEVAHHLADSDRVAAFRFRMILAHDAPSLPGYDQDLWAERLRYRDTDPETVLHDFAEVRRSNVHLLERTTPEERQRVMRHSERGEESLAHLIRMHAGHDVVHLRQIARIRAAIGASLLPGG